MQTLLRRSLACLAFLSACAQVDSAPDDPSLSADKVDRGAAAGLTHRLPPGSTSTLSVHTLANATCQLTSADQPDATRSLRVYSDDNGVARVQFDHLDTGVRHGQLRLDCIDDAGKQRSHPIEVVIDERATPQAPEPYDGTGRAKLAKLDVPASSLSDADLHARHYPPRPDAAKSPEQFATWTALTSSEPTVITPHIVADESRRHSNATTSGNWSGYVLTSPPSAPIYAWIYGEWNVPRAYAESGFYSSDHSSFWVGIDGFGSNDVVQDGTDSNTLTVFWVQTSSYDAWVEWYPLSSQTVSNFPVNPGDRIHAWTWMKDSAGNYSATPTVGWFYMWNQTQNYYVSYSINTPSGAKFSGHQAEWVLERPTVLGSTSNLANYSYAQLTNALTYDLWGGSHLYGGDSSNTSWNVTMTNGPTVLSTVAPINSNTMAFTFHSHS